MIFKKTVSAILCLTLVVTLLAGCGSETKAPEEEKTTTPATEQKSDQNTTQNTESAGKGSVRWLNYKPEIADALQEVAAVYTQETGNEIKIETAASNQYPATLAARMDSSNAPTIFIVEGASMLSVWKDHARDLSGTKIHSYVTDESYILKDDEGIARGLSYTLEAWGILVNKKITDAYFASPNKKTQYTSLDDLYTFKALKAVVEDMTAMKEELGIQGVFGSTSLKAGDDWRYQTMLMNQPLYWEWGGNDKIDLNGLIPEFSFEYNEGYKAILDLYLNNSLIDPKLVGTKTVDDSMAEFALGQCAMIQNGDWSWTTVADTEKRVVADEDVCFIPITIGVSGEEKMGLNVGASQYMCVNSQASEEDQNASLAFLEWLFSSETGKKLVAQKLQLVTPFSPMADAVYTNPLFASENQIAAAGKTAYCWAVALIPTQTWRDNFGAKLLMYAQGQMAWEDVVKQTVEDWVKEREIANAEMKN